MGTSFRYDRTFEFDVGSGVLWDALTDTGSYQHWWPWLRSFVAGGGADGGVLAPGAIASCTVRAPLPYSLSFDVHVDRVEAGAAIDTHVTGDLRGPARLEVAAIAPRPTGPASTARLTWAVDLQLPVLSAAARVARPVLVWAHDRVVATGVEQFRRHALSPSQDLG